jgi:hypothetical protein
MVKSERRRAIRRQGFFIGLLVAIIVGYFGCSEIEVQETACFADCAVRVVLRDGWRSTTIASASDCWISFAQAAWSGPIVGVFVDGRICGQIKAAYSVQSRVGVQFEAAEDAVRMAIVREYSVQPHELAKAHNDPLVWATYDQFEEGRAAGEFRKHHSRKP